MANGVVASYNQGKPQMTLKAIATLADVGAGNVAVIIGTSIGSHRTGEARRRLWDCLQTLRERGFPKPTTAANYVSAGVPIDQGKGQVSFSLDDASTSTPAETDVAVVYNDTFDNAPHSTENLHAMVIQAIEVINERGLVTQ